MTTLRRPPTTTAQEEPNHEYLKHFNVRQFVSGGVAGSVAKTLVAPIDRVKILLQVHSRHYEGYGIFESFYRIVQKEGFRALYNGNGAQMLRIFPYAAMQFSSYETYKHVNRIIFREKADYFVNSLACGSLAGITAVTTTYPLDVIRSRLAFQYKGERVYNGIIDAIKKIYLERHSLTSFYRGYSITLLGMIPYAGLSFSSFEHIKLYMLRSKIAAFTVESTKSDAQHKQQHQQHHSQQTSAANTSDKYFELTVLGKLICGALTGVVAQTVTYPLDVVRRHMQLVTMFHDAATRQAMGIVQTMLFVYNKYGVVNGLYRGITLNYLRAVPMVSTSFCFYELSKQYLGLETSARISTG